MVNYLQLQLPVITADELYDAGFYCHFNYHDHSGNCNVLHQYSYDDQETEPGISQLSEIAKTGCAFMQHPVFFYIKHNKAQHLIILYVTFLPVWHEACPSWQAVLMPPLLCLM